MSKFKKNLILAISLVAAIAVFVGAYFIFAPKATEGNKQFSIAVIANSETVIEKNINTDEEFLRAAIETELKLVGSDSDFGMFVTEVYGIKADDTKKEWWCFNQDGEMLNTGIDTTPIVDGAKYEVVLSTY